MDTTETLAPIAPILICILGEFRVLKAGQPVKIVSGSKTEKLLSSLALPEQQCVLRDVLLNSLWPDNEPALAHQSLNSLIYNLRKLLGDGIEGASPIISTDGVYCLNTEAGIDVDVRKFEALAAEGQRRARANDHAAAIELYKRALALYHGDLRAGSDVQAVILRERLRVRYLTMLATLAEHYFDRQDYVAALDYCLRLLASDPFREDAHRLAMRCHVRLGQRAEALRQYRVCEQLLRAEFETAPEASSKELFDLIRLDPNRV